MPVWDQLPVPSGGRRPVGCRVRRFVAVADWLSDLFEEGEDADTNRRFE